MVVDRWLPFYDKWEQSVFRKSDVFRELNSDFSRTQATQTGKVESIPVAAERRCISVSLASYFQHIAFSTCALH